MSITTACDAILAAPVFTTADAINLLRAMQYRLAATPLQQPERNELAAELTRCSDRLFNVHTSQENPR